MQAAPRIAIEDPDQPEIHALLAEADRYYAGLYPPEENHLLDVATLRTEATAFFVARQGSEVLGYGAVVRRGRDPGGLWGEVKRMYVAPAARGKRIGKALLDALEAHARQIGIRCLRLETGNRQPEALGLYRTAGYDDIPPFAGYGPSDYSLFMEKLLG
jgi:putative acetyltransferase